MSSEITEESATLEGEQESATRPWAEQIDEVVNMPELVSNGESVDEVEIPDTLRQLISVSGICLVAVPENTWNVDGYAAKLCRCYSATFSIDDEISGSDVVEAFMEVGVDIEHIFSIQFRSSNHSWCVFYRQID